MPAALLLLRSYLIGLTFPIPIHILSRRSSRLQHCCKVNTAPTLAVVLVTQTLKMDCTTCITLLDLYQIDQTYLLHQELQQNLVLCHRRSGIAVSVAIFSFHHHDQQACPHETDQQERTGRRVLGLSPSYECSASPAPCHCTNHFLLTSCAPVQKHLISVTLVPPTWVAAA